MRADFVFPKFKLLSGAERLILGIAAALARRGHEIRIVCHAFDPTCRAVAEGLEVVETRVRLDWTGNHYVDSIASYLLARGLRRWTDPAAEVVCLFGPALPMAFGRRPPGQRLLYFCYEPPRALAVDRSEVLERVGPGRWILSPALAVYRRIDHALVRRVDRVLVAGGFARDLVRREYGIDSSIVTPGVSLPPTPCDRPRARERLGIDPAAPVAVTVNFLHPRKRVDLTLRAWAEVERRVPGARLLVVGDGPERERLGALARSLGLRGAMFVGFVPDAELARFYAASDLLVHATRRETFGLTILEAASFAVPAVAVDEGGPCDTIVDGESGLLVPADPAAIAGAVGGLLLDRARASGMGRRARLLVRDRFSWERGAEDFLAVCRALEAGGAAAARAARGEASAARSPRAEDGSAG